MTLHEGLTRVIEDARDHSRKNFNVVKESYGQYLARAILASDALRERDAEKWDEGADAMAEHIDNGAGWEIQNPYRTREEQS